MIFSFGLHVETKLLNDEVKPKSEGTRLPVTNDLEAKDRLLEQQLATLTTTGSRKEWTGGRGGGRGRGREGRGRGGRGVDTRMCYGCHKKGHIRRDCPDEVVDDTATLAVGFPAIVIHPSPSVQDGAIIMSSAPLNCPESARHLGWTWDYLRLEYVDPHVYPKVSDVQIDKASGLHYYSIDTLPMKHVATRNPPAAKKIKRVPSTQVEKPISQEFELTHDFSFVNNVHHSETTSTIQQVAARPSHIQRRFERAEAHKQRRQAHPPEPLRHQPVEIHDPKRPHADVKASRSSTPSVLDRPAIKKHLRRATPTRNGIRKMAFLISISSSSRKNGHRQINRRTQRYALLLMRRLRRSNPWKRPPKGHKEPQHHAALASTSYTVDSGPKWVVDSGASRHFSAVLSDFSSITVNDKLGTVSGIDCKIEGSGSISFIVHDRRGKHVQMNLTDDSTSPSSQNDREEATSDS
jgi:hypothetical protein